MDQLILEHEDFRDLIIENPDSINDDISHKLKWSRVYLKRGGAILKLSPDFFTLTEKGKAIRSVEQTQQLQRLVNENDHWWQDDFE